MYNHNFDENHIGKYQECKDWFSQTLDVELKGQNLIINTILLSDR